jgi:cytochrome P450
MPLLPRIRSIARSVAERMARPGQRVLFSFAGASGAWPGMGRETYRREAAFRDAVDASSAVVEEVLGWSPAPVFRGEEDAPDAPGLLARRNRFVLLGTMQIAQVELWREAGVTPGGVVSVSMGEIAAAYAAGALSRGDCARALAVMAQEVSRRRSPERMFLLDADEAEARRLCRAAPAPLDYLGSAAPRLAAVLGREPDADVLRAFLGGSVTREVATDASYHTPRLGMDLARAEERLRGLAQRPPACPVYSAAAGGALPAGTPFDARFFAWALSRPFHFADAVSAALEDGFDLVVSIGAAPSTAAQVAATARARGRAVSLVDTAREGDETGAWKRARAAVRPLRAPRPAAPPAWTPRTLHLDDPAVAGRLPEVYEELRRLGPVHHLERHGFWLVLDFEPVQRALADWRRFSSALPVLERIDPVLLGSDPPAHTAVRRLLAEHFSSATVARRGRLAEAAAERLLQPLAEGREMDVVRDLADPLADAVGGDVLGLDADAVATLREPTLTAGGDTARLYAELRAPIDAVAHRSALYHALLRGADGALDDAAARSLLRLLWIAGTGEPRRVLASAVLLLLRDDGARARVAADPRLAGPFVDEVLRLLPPELVTRTTTQEVELGGARIPAGAVVQLCLFAANRDPARFPDPAAIRLDRPPGPHLAFGGGVHRCVGAPLARAQLTAAVGALLRLAPGFRAVQPPGTVRHVGGAPFRPVRELVIGP